MHLNKKIVFTCLLPLMLMGCSGEDSENRGQTGEHVWKEQTDTLEKAQQVEQVLDDSFQERKSATE